MSLFSKLSDWAIPDRRLDRVVGDSGQQRAQSLFELPMPLLSDALAFGYLVFFNFASAYSESSRAIGVAFKATLALSLSFIFGRAGLLGAFVEYGFDGMISVAKLVVNILLFPYNWARDGFFLSAAGRIYDSFKDIAFCIAEPVASALQYVVLIPTIIPVAIVRSLSRVIFGTEPMSNSAVTPANASDVVPLGLETGVEHTNDRGRRRRADEGGSYRLAVTGLVENAPAEAEEHGAEEAVTAAVDSECETSDSGIHTSSDSDTDMQLAGETGLAMVR